MNTQSNPRPCEHSMVTDLCGICIRDEHIKELERERDTLQSKIDAMLHFLKDGSHVYVMMLRGEIATPHEFEYRQEVIGRLQAKCDELVEAIICLKSARPKMRDIAIAKADEAIAKTQAW